MEPNEASPVVRQLDFTANFGNVHGIADSSLDLLMPEHTQTQFQSSLMALAQSHPVHACESFLSQVRSRRVAESPSTRPLEIMPTPNPALQNTRPPRRERISREQNNDTPKKQKQCNCKHSRCLKLYCECFLAQVYCDGCNCTNCCNNKEHESERNESIVSILERNPEAFLPKIAKSPSGTTTNGGGVQVEHKKGCKCKKSNCLKRYCECFQANVFCSDKCNCVGCKNCEESEERKSLFSERPSNNLMIANAAVNAALETTIKNSKNQVVVSGASHNAQLPQSLKENHLKSDAFRSPSSFRFAGPPKTYRSPLCGILQAQDVNDFCTILVELSTKAASAPSEAMKLNDTGIDIDMNEPQVPVASTRKEDGIEDHQKNCNAMDSCENQEKKNANDSNTLQDARPLSPGTVALMCNERDKDFLTFDAQREVNECKEFMNTAMENGVDQTYIKQERLVLTTFRSFLDKLITYGSIEESKIDREASLYP